MVISIQNTHALMDLRGLKLICLIFFSGVLFCLHLRLKNFIQNCICEEILEIYECTAKVKCNRICYSLPLLSFECKSDFHLTSFIFKFIH